jgi:hypothetical protein
VNFTLVSGNPIPGVVNPVDFDEGPSFASICGPGFTANSAYGVTLSGNGPGTGTSDPNTYFVVPLSGATHNRKEFTVLTAIPGGSASAQPFYYASPDGTVAAIGSAQVSVGLPYQVALYDLLSGGNSPFQTFYCDGSASLSLSIGSSNVVNAKYSQNGASKMSQYSIP